MTIAELQKGITDWFRLVPEEYKSFARIKNVCDKLYHRHFSEHHGNTAIYSVFYPLLRYGTIEFYPERQFGLSPSCCIYADHSNVLINVPDALLNLYDGLCEFDNGLGIRRYKRNVALENMLKKQNIPVSQFRLGHYLSMTPDLDAIIGTWTDETVFTRAGFYFFDGNRNWTDQFGLNQRGVFKKKKDAFAKRLLRISDAEWKLIPVNSLNMDGFNLAVTYGQLVNKLSINVCYDRHFSKLVISSGFFPIVFERLLVLNTLVSGKQGYDVSTREYFISDKDFLILNKILKYKIEIK